MVDLTRLSVQRVVSCSASGTSPIRFGRERGPDGGVGFAKARRGDLTNFTGIDSPYEAPEIHIDASALTVEESAQRIVDYLIEPGVLRG
jgi:bifunctional enzyme CysN/CysC